MHKIQLIYTGTEHFLKSSYVTNSEKKKEPQYYMKKKNTNIILRWFSLKG